MVSEIGLKVVLVLFGGATLIFAVDFLMRKLLKVEKRFSFKPINRVHKIFDRTIRITFLIGIILSTYFNIYEDMSNIPWYLDAWFLLALFFFLTDSLRAFMEWKYEKHSKEYILTLCEMVLAIGLIVCIASTNFLSF